MNNPKILLWDVESSFNQVVVFDLYDTERGIPYDNIQIERHLFCVSYKWLGEKKVHTISILDDPKRFAKDIHDDYYVISEFAKVLEQADADVGHFSTKFDLPMLTARMAFHNLKPLPRIIHIDTKFIASRNFKFNSNRLDYLAKFLGYKGKMDNPKNLWLDCFKGDKKAIRHMERYNRVDVEILEFVFNRLKPFVTSKLNMNMFLEGAVCPSCGSAELHWRGWNYTRTTKYRRCQCQSCGAWSNERTATKTKPEIK